MSTNGTLPINEWAKQNPEAARRGRKKGGKNKAKKEAYQKEIKFYLQALLESTITTKTGEQMTGAQAMATKVFQEALRGDWKAWELARDTSGQKPVEKMVVGEVDAGAVAEVERMIANAKKNKNNE